MEGDVNATVCREEEVESRFRHMAALEQVESFELKSLCIPFIDNSLYRDNAVTLVRTSTQYVGSELKT